MGNINNASCVQPDTVLLIVELLEDMLYSYRCDISNKNVTALQLSYTYFRRLAFGLKLEITKEYTEAAIYTECDFMLK